MNKFLKITKINLMNFFNFKKLNKDGKKSAFKILLFGGLIVYFMFYVYELVDFMMPGFLYLNMPYYGLGYVFAILSTFIIVTNILKVKNIIFDFKDYDLLMSLPIKRNIVIYSKLVSFYMLNLLYTFVVMIPSYIAFIKYYPVNSFLYFFLMLFIPIVPFIISLIIGIFISWIVSFFKNKNLGNYVTNILIIVVALFISFSMQNKGTIDIATSGINYVHKINNVYPLTNIYVQLLDNFRIIDFTIYLLVPIVLTIIFVLIINYSYDLIRSKLLKTNIISDYHLTKYHHNSTLMGLYKKELKRYFSTSMYVLNTAFGCIMLIILIICLLIFNDKTVADFLNIDDFSNLLKNSIPFIISLCCVMSSTTNSSISLEGKSLWIMKSIPVSVDKIFLSKIMVNLTILIPTIIISSTFFGIYLHLNLLEFILIYLIPFAYALLSAFLGILFNLIFPKFDFTNEVQVIKQSISVFLSMIIGLISVIVPMGIDNLTSNNLIAILLIVIFVDIVIYIIIHYYGQTRVKSF